MDSRDWFFYVASDTGGGCLGPVSVTGGMGTQWKSVIYGPLNKCQIYVCSPEKSNGRHSQRLFRRYFKLSLEHIWLVLSRFGVSIFILFYFEDLYLNFLRRLLVNLSFSFLSQHTNWGGSCVLNRNA